MAVKKEYNYSVMSENGSKMNGIITSLLWVRGFGMSPVTLTNKQRRAIRDLGGEKGVRSRLNKPEAVISTRGRMSVNGGVDSEEALKRLVNGGLPQQWDFGSMSPMDRQRTRRIGDMPEHWVNREISELATRGIESVGGTD